MTLSKSLIFALFAASLISASCEAQTVKTDEPLATIKSEANAPQIKLQQNHRAAVAALKQHCLLYTSPSPRDLSTSRMPSSA